ncbi:Protein kinase [Phlyctochytrium planicorne]|nr:Protein kinase [Phlyctochytrium planicorne]
MDIDEPDQTSTPLNSVSRPNSLRPSPIVPDSTIKTIKHVQSFDVDSQKRINDYMILETLGKGGFGKVKMAKHVTTGVLYAVKIISKLALKSKCKTLNLFQREIRLVKLLHHPHIISVKETMEDAQQIVMVMEYAPRGTLFDYMVVHAPLPEPQSRHFFRQLLSVVDYCHRNSIVHRDLKPENCLLDVHGNIKVSDFGLANTFHQDRLLETSCGTVFYRAPEIDFGKKYSGPGVDIWSLGIILYVMLAAKFPFGESDRTKFFKSIKTAPHLQIPLICKNASDDAQKLLGRMLVVDCTVRAKMPEIMNHPWVNTGHPAPPKNFHIEYLPTVTHPKQDALTEIASYGISASEAIRILSKPGPPHPIKSLYHLVDHYLDRMWMESFRVHTDQRHAFGNKANKRCELQRSSNFADRAAARRRQEVLVNCKRDLVKILKEEGMVGQAEFVERMELRELERVMMERGWYFSVSVKATQKVLALLMVSRKALTGRYF